MLFKLEIYSSPGFKDWESFDWNQFCSFWPLASGDKPKDSYYISAGPCRLTDEEVMGLLNMGMKVEVVPYPGAMITKMSDRAKWDYGAPVLSESINNGSAVQISIPDFALLTINEVKVVEDYCTEELQSELDEGWRILAVCPPNAARRPDYVLGRRK